VKGSFKDGAHVVAVGSGSSLETALLSALAQSAALLGSQGPDFTRAFGKISIRSKSADNLSSPAAVGAKQVVKQITELTFRRGPRVYSLSLREVAETEGGAKRSRQELQTESAGLTLSDLIDELAKQGFDFREWRDPADYVQYAQLERGA
jgi:hypothetical protein